MSMQLPGAVAAMTERVDTVTETYAVRVGTAPVPTGARTSREIDKAVIPRHVSVTVDRSESTRAWLVRSVEITGVHRVAEGRHEPAPVAAVFDREALRRPGPPAWAAELAFAVEGRLQIEGEEELLTRRQAVELLRSLGRPVTERAIANYNQNPPSRWPGVERHMGRTPLYSASKLTDYARGQ